MDCEQFRELMSEYLDGELDTDQSDQMQAHAEACEPCRLLLEDMRGLLSDLNDLDSDMPVPIEAQAAWHKAVRNESKARRPAFGLLSRCLATAAAALLVLVGATMFNRSPAIVTGTPAGETLDGVVTMEEVIDEIEPATAAYEQELEAVFSGDMWMSDGALKKEEMQGEAEAVQEPHADAVESVRVVRSATLSIRTEDYQNDRMLLENTVMSNGGYFEQYEELLEDAPVMVALIRVPAAQFEDFLTEVQLVGKLTDKTQQSENVNSRYVDLDARITLCDEKLKRLYEMQESCENVDDLIAISNNIEETIQERETLQSQRNGLDYTVSYASVRLTLYAPGANLTGIDGETLSAGTTGLTMGEQVPDEKVSERISDGFSESVEWLKTFATDAFVLLVSSLPRLVIWIPALVLAILLVRWLVRRKK